MGSRIRRERPGMGLRMESNSVGSGVRFKDRMWINSLPPQDTGSSSPYFPFMSLRVWDSGWRNGGYRSL